MAPCVKAASPIGIRGGLPLVRRTGATRSAAKSQNTSDIPISKNTAAWNLFHQAVDGVPGRHCTQFSRFGIQHRGGEWAAQALRRANGKKGKWRGGVLWVWHKR